MTVSQKEMSLVRSMATARVPKCVSRTPRAAELATLPFARNSLSIPKKRLTPENTPRRTLMMSASEVTTVIAVIMVTVREPIKYALRIDVEKANATHRNVRIFKFRCKRSARKSLMIEELTQITKESRSSPSISRKMTLLSSKINASSRETLVSRALPARRERCASMTVLTRDSAILHSVLTCSKLSTTKRKRRVMYLRKASTNALIKLISVEEQLTAQKTRFVYLTEASRDTASQNSALP